MKKIITLLFSFHIIACSLTSQVLVNGNFENWSDFPYFNFEEPDGWLTSNIAGVPAGLPANATKSTDTYDGTYALKLETINDPVAEPYTGAAVCNSAIDKKPTKIEGYYKSSILGNDIAAMAIVMQANGTAIGGGDIEFESSKSSYTYFEVPIEYFVPNTVPDFFTLSVFSSAEEGTIGSTLFIDNLTFDGITTGSVDLKENIEVQVVPNPTADFVKIDIGTHSDNVNLIIYDDQGRITNTRNLLGSTAIDVSKYTNGQYYFEIRNSNGRLLAKNSFLVLK